MKYAPLGFVLMKTWFHIQEAKISIMNLFLNLGHWAKYHWIPQHFPSYEPWHTFIEENQDHFELKFFLYALPTYLFYEVRLTLILMYIRAAIFICAT